MIVGLTGAVGAGKSTLAKRLAARGADVLDVDMLAATAAMHVGLRPADALSRVVNGDRELEGRIAALVKERLGSWLSTARRPAVIDAAVLFEHQLETHCTLTVCLTCDAATRKARVKQRSTASAQHFEAIERTQWPEAEKAKRATHVISTDGSLDEAEAALVRLVWP